MIEDYYVSITRKVPTNPKNSKFEYVPSYTQSTINGYIGSRTDIQQPEGGKWTVKTQYRFFSDTNCNHGDIVVFNSENYRLISDMQNTINLGHHYKGYVEKVEGVD